MLTGNHSTKRVLEIATRKWGLRTRPIFGGGGPLALSAVYTLFRRPFYYGAIRQNGALYPGKHKPMITKSEFDRVQSIMNRKSAPRPKRHAFAYTGLIKCGECGASVTAEHKMQRHGHRYVYYHCTHRKVGSSCAQGVVEVEQLEMQIRSFLESVTLPKGIFGLVEWVMRDNQGDEIEQEKAELDSLQKRIAEIGRELEGLTDMCIRKLIPDEEYVAKRNKLEEERFGLREAVHKNDGRIERTAALTLAEFRFSENAVRRFESGSIVQRRAMVQWIGSNLTLLDGKLVITPRKPLELIQRTLASPGVRNGWIEPPEFSELKRRISRPSRVFTEMCSLIEDVRTYVMKNGHE
jgi:cell division protein FtsB